MITIISDGYLKENKILNKILTHKSTICYIPSWHHGKEVDKDFRRFQRIFKNFNCILCNLDKNIDHSSLIKESDIVFIDGGNTFFLLKYLKKSGIKKALKTRDIIAKSAGAIALSPSIITAKYPLENADEDYYKTKNLKGLGLIKFKIYPHYEGLDFENSFLATQTNIKVLKDGDYINTYA